MSAPTVHVSATPTTPAQQLGCIQARLTALLAHLAVRQPTEETLLDLLALQAQLEAIAEVSLDRVTAASARTLADLVRDVRADIGLLSDLGPKALTTWEARR